MLVRVAPYASRWQRTTSAISDRRPRRSRRRTCLPIGRYQPGVRQSRGEGGTDTLTVLLHRPATRLHSLRPEGANRQAWCRWVVCFRRSAGRPRREWASPGTVALTGCARSPLRLAGPPLGRHASSAAGCTRRPGASGPPPSICACEDVLAPTSDLDRTSDYGCNRFCGVASTPSGMPSSSVSGSSGSEPFWNSVRRVAPSPSVSEPATCAVLP